MTIVVAYADTHPGHAAIEAALESAAPGETIVLAPAVRGEPAPTIAEAEVRWPALTGRVEIGRSDLADPSDAVVQVAQRLDARLVVLGLRHRSAVGKIVFGSTAQRILLDATCPVLAVKPSDNQPTSAR